MLEISSQAASEQHNLKKQCHSSSTSREVAENILPKWFRNLVPLSESQRFWNVIFQTPGLPSEQTKVLNLAQFRDYPKPFYHSFSHEFSWLMIYLPYLMCNYASSNIGGTFHIQEASYKKLCLIVRGLFVGTKHLLLLLLHDLGGLWHAKSRNLPPENN